MVCRASSANMAACCPGPTATIFIETGAYRLPPMSPIGDEMLDLSDERRTTSRLSCQIDVTGELDGLQVATLESQE
jgi:2Fe-2S ferredoxin